MENPGFYISELLSEHDCVIVPGFGGFVARPAPAHFSKAGNMLMPPGKSLVFNKNLDNSDGLLAHHISKKLHISYRESNTLIEQWVFNAKRQLELQKRLELEKTGVLYYSPENTLLFEPAASSNHQVSSFGLIPVKAVKLVVEAEPKTIEEKIYRQAEAKSRGSRTVARISVIVSSALLFMFLLFITAKQLPISNALASLNPFANKESGYKIKSYELNKLASTNTSKVAGEIKNNITLKAAENSRVFVIAETVNIDKTKVIKPIRSFSGNSEFNSPFQIVVGCFAVEGNAHKLIHQLAKDGIPAGISGRNPRGLYVVSLAGFTTESLARVKLDQAKLRFPSAWILVK